MTTVTTARTAKALGLEPGRVVLAFNGAVTTRIIPHPQRAFAFEVTFSPSQWPDALKDQKPPKHFHPIQEEYIEVLEGVLCVEDDNQEYTLRPTSGEFLIRPWVNHRCYPPTGYEGNIKFLLAGEETPEPFRLDTIFFENWYGYQDETVVAGKGVDLIQVLSMFDAGGSYMSFPWWVPFGRTLSMTLGVVVGRWIGGLLGYQPYYKKWTFDWDLACRKMEQSIFQRRFADRTKTD
ncbi:hypothetical protein N8T08_004552 [Aspergillus melleus]|uniref:Uncharacterized protein n=1 Tax=Aspergillus melleus TaxID=138277 RepID=A0ACC3B5A7_9EURO|nr:hypothetical protein N8T08_004552 [Aspergillus melleus]